MITLEQALSLVDRIIQPERLNSVQELVFTECWRGKTATYELESMGLVKIQGNKVTPRCELYRLYFRDRL